MGLRHIGDAAPWAERRERALRRTTDAPAARPWWDDQVVWFLAALHLPDDVVTGVRMNDRYEPVATTVKAADGSWADVEIEPDATGHRAVRGSTPDLWRAVEDAYDLWRRLDRPGWDRLGLTVGSANEQHVWIDDPGGEHVWLLP